MSGALSLEPLLRGWGAFKPLIEVRSFSMKPPSEGECCDSDAEWSGSKSSPCESGAAEMIRSVGCNRSHSMVAPGQFTKKRYLQSVDLGGLSFLELAKRTARASWRDAVFGQGSRMAFYHFLAIFPALLLLLALAARMPGMGAESKDAILNLSRPI